MTETGNLFRKTWGNLDSHELKLLFNEKIGGNGQVDGDITEDAPFYLPMADDTCQIEIRFKNKKINSILPGKGFDKEKWVEISKLIDELISSGQKKVGRQISFSAKPVNGYWYGANSNIQIYPPPQNALMPNELIAENPFVLEFPFVRCGINRIDSYRLRREHRRYTSALNVILFSQIQFHGMRQKKFWAQLWPQDASNGGVEYRWVQSGYFTDIGAIVADKHSVGFEQPIKMFTSSEYYLPQTFRGDWLTVPDNLDELLCLYQKLSFDDKEKFDRAAYWFYLAARQWEMSASASFVSLVSAIEAFVGRGKIHTLKCPKCNKNFDHEVPGAIQRFKDFLEKYAPGSGLNKQRNEMYALRSKIAHGSGLLMLDSEHYSRWDPASESERNLQSDLWSVTKMAMLNWLKHSGDLPLS
jgi:hypothetical protein